MGEVEAFDELATGADGAMVVVTTAVDDERAGCLVGFHVQCSITPRRWAVWLSKANHTYRVALLAPHLAVHFLAEGDLALAELFGTMTGDDTDKFARCSWRPGPGGVPLLESCDHGFAGRRTALLDDGSDHVCVIVEPSEVWSHGPLRPLRLSALDHLVAGHEAEERPRPPTERA